jgi:hypothetical protein
MAAMAKSPANGHNPTVEIGSADGVVMLRKAQIKYNITKGGNIKGIVKPNVVRKTGEGVNNKVLESPKIKPKIRRTRKNLFLSLTANI